MNELKTHICQFCKRKYQSTGERKIWRTYKSGRIDYYDSNLYCSKDCRTKVVSQKRSIILKQKYKDHPELKCRISDSYKQTLQNNPEIIKKRIEKLKQTYKNHPEIVNRQLEKRTRTLMSNPDIRKRSVEKQRNTWKLLGNEIMKKSLQKRRQTLQNNPEIAKQATKNRLQTLMDNPEIMKGIVEKRSQTLRDNPEIMKRAGEKHSKTLREHHEIEENRKELYKQTIKNNPEIIKLSRKKFKITLQNNPEITKQATRKRMQTLQKNPEVEKQRRQKLSAYYKNHPEELTKKIEKLKQTLQNNPEIMKKSHEKAQQTIKDNPEIERQRNERHKQTVLQQFKKEHPNYFELFKSYEDVLNYITNNSIKTKRELANKLNIDPCTLINHLSQDFELNEQFDSLLNGSVSSYEKEICNFLDQLNIKYELHNRTIIKPYEVDIYLPDYKIGIEFNGDLYHGEYLYWSNELHLNREPNYHWLKSQLAQEKGIFLFHIFEYEWTEKSDIFLSMIKNLCNKNDYKIHARKCIIKEIESKISNEFLNKNHLQGQDNSSIRYGLFYENQLVSVMTFCKPKFNKKYDYELSRFCSLKNYTIIGGANKLFTHFVRDNPGKSIISYSNIAHTKGLIYEKLGFKLLQVSSPNYIWFKYKRTEENKKFPQILKRYQTQKHNLTDFEVFGKTEVEIMTNLGYYRIFDCGNKVWAYNDYELTHSH